jgi:hypothetical protein
MSTSTLITAKTEQEKKALWTDVSEVLYQGYLTFDGTPAAVELFIGGIDGRRLQVPDDTVVMGWYTVGVANITDDTYFMQTGMFSVGNDGGTTGFDPTELDQLANFAAGSGSNPVIVGGNTMEGTFAITANDTNDALQVAYTGAANDTYSVLVR